MGTRRPHYCRPHANNIRLQATHRPHTHTSATLNGHVQFPFHFGCNPVTLFSFRKLETQNLHPEGICFWQTELSGGSATTLGFRIPVRSFTMSPDRCPLLDGDQWLVCLYRFPQAFPQHTFDGGHYTSTVVVSTHRGAPAPASPHSGFAVVRAQPGK